ncbi:MAG: adenylate/guanylate cyclase domain-containing protein [Desulfomonilia bacterium]|nr:adenylate/guanylate cyclase domain-containing protein [Desulfomonilia bacterium]
MGHIFLSHVERDLAIMEQIARGLEAAGFSTWYFERDVFAGTSYLIQITHALESSDAIVLIASPNACSSDQVTREVVGAFERGKPFFPVLVNMTPPELKACQPEWRHALGGTAMITVGSEGLTPAISRIIEGLKAKGVQPGGVVTTEAHPIPGRAPAVPGRPEGERKNVTVMFADISGFTAMSEKLDAEEVTEIMNECFSMMEMCIEEHGGTIDKFMGDCVMALFGAPRAMEDGPHRALNTALEIRKRLREFNDLKHLATPLDIHIGINTGPVIAGMMGGDRRQDFTVMGDTVNLASRMESTAKTGEILVTENTYHETEGYFDFEDVGPLTVKGKEQPVQSYRLMGTRQVKTRIAASLGKGLTAFQGRSREMAQLMDCYEQVKEGHGQVVGVMGEPGMGKSRLIREFIRSLPDEEYMCLEGGCLHFGDAIPYLPILDILKDSFDIKEDDGEASIKQKMITRVHQRMGSLESILPPLHEILSLKVEDEAYQKLDGKQRRDKVFEAIRVLLVAESQMKPLVVVVEDLHWIDKTSEEFLSYLIGSIATARIMLILLYRPEYNPAAWVTKTYYSQVRVDQLPRKASTDLVQAILDSGEVASELNELIVTRTAGNPLFLEELTQSLLENGSIEKAGNRYMLCCLPSEISIPGTIQGIIASRLDRLEEHLKRIIQTASVIGREFAFRILQAVATLKEDLASSLLTLQDLEFIYEKNLFPELEYIFKHALTQEVAYNSLLIKKRRETHERVGRAVEQLYADRLEEFYEVLAYHYSLSNSSPKAFQYLKLSGDKASRNYSNWETIRFYREALRVLGSWPDNDDNRKEKLQLLLLLQKPFLLLGFPEGSLEILLQSEALAQEMGDQRALANFHRSLSLYHTFKEDLSLGVTYGEQCFHGALSIDEVDLVTQSADQLCMAYYIQGDSLKSVDVSQRALELFETHRLGKDLTTGGLNVYSALCVWNGAALNFLGRFEEAATMLEKGLRNAREVNDWFEIGNGEFQYSVLMMLKGDGDGTIAHAREAIRSFERAETGILRGTSWSLLGVGHCFRDEHETARTHAEKGLSIQRELGMNNMTAYCNWFLSLILWVAGDLARAREHGQEALNVAREIQARQLEGMTYPVLGGITGKGEPTSIDEAQHYIQQGITLCEELKLKPLAMMGYLFLGELLVDADRREEARDNLKKAETLCQEMDVSPQSYWLKRTREALAKVG